MATPERQHGQAVQTGETHPLAAMHAHSKPRLALLDALRGFAAMWVVLFHFGEGGQIRTLQSVLPGWIDRVVFAAGHSGVPVFFVLSGFVIAHSIGSDRVTGRYLGRFVLRRSIRLDLPYWLSIALTLAFAAAKAATLGRTFDWPSAGVIGAHMFYLQDLLQVRSINSVYWTLCFEIQFYILFCVLLWFVTSRDTPAARERSRAIVFVFAAIISLIWPAVSLSKIPGVSLVYFHGFLLGALISWWHRKVIAIAWPIAYAVALLCLFAVTRNSFTLACVITAVFIMFAHARGALGTWLTQWLPQLLGRISYSLYLIHVPISGALFVLCFRVLQHTPVHEALAMVIVLLGNCAAADIFWRIAERPSTALARRIRKG